jgi:hypothetical protein
MYQASQAASFGLLPLLSREVSNRGVPHCLYSPHATSIAKATHPANNRFRCEPRGKRCPGVGYSPNLLEAEFSKVCSLERCGNSLILGMPRAPCRV